MIGNCKRVPVVAIGGVALAVALMVAMTGYLKPQVTEKEIMPAATEAALSIVAMAAEVPTTMPEEVTEEPSATELRCEPFVSNQYIQFSQPTTNSAAFVHEQEVEGASVVEKYYILIADEKRLLYQVDFGAEKEGNWIGLLEINTVEVPVSYTIYAMSDEELAAMNEVERQHYSELMSGLGIVLDSIMADSRFRTEKSLPVGKEQEARLMYWSLVLPGNMSWVETNEDGEYQAVFYGKVKGEQVPLYTVRIGEVEAQTVLGKYRVDDLEKKVSVESYDLPHYENWQEEDYSTAYQMMATINDVIQIIDASADFIPE